MMKVLFLVLAAIAICSAQMYQQVSTAQQNQNDADTLNYALTLEHLEATYYTQGLAMFNASAFMMAGYSNQTRNNIDLIRQQEDIHVQTLTSVLQSGGYTPVGACMYNFTAAFSSVNMFIYYASLFEQTGVSAYDGAANTINNAEYLQVAATIATVEGRHSAYLNELRNNTPFPAAFEPTLTPAQVEKIVAGFLENCPNNFTNPVFAYNFVPLSPNYTYYNQSGQEETSEQIANDNEVLNYALTLELFGSAFYNASRRFSQADFAAAGYASAYNYFQMIIMQENAHVQFLQMTLASRNAAAAQPCTYNLANITDSVQHVMAFAQMLEGLEVTAYDGAINDLTDYQLIQGAATIATVEARHSQFLTAVVLNVPVDNFAFDMTNTPAQILNITSPLFGADCMAPAVPVEAFTLQAYGAEAVMPSPTVMPSYTPMPTPTYSSCPTPTPTYSSCPPPPPSPCGCGAPPPPPASDDSVTINFYFADILRGL